MGLWDKHLHSQLRKGVENREVCSDRLCVGMVLALGGTNKPCLRAPPGASSHFTRAPKGYPAHPA